MIKMSFWQSLKVCTESRYPLQLAFANHFHDYFSVQNRRPIISLFLVFFLLFTQQVGYAHAISHLSGSNSSTTKNSQLPVEQACEHCLVFAQLGSALRTDPIFFAVTPIAAEIPQIRSTQLHFLRTICVFQSRAPPAFI